jgi:hypothetical protein
MAWRVESPLLHDGIAYAPGDVVGGGLFTETQAAHLVSTGTITPAADSERESRKGQPESGEAAETPSPLTTRRGSSRPTHKHRESEDAAEAGAAEQADPAATSPGEGEPLAEGGAA